VTNDDGVALDFDDPKRMHVMNGSQQRFYLQEASARLKKARRPVTAIFRQSQRRKVVGS
jgi:hypothetical protein